MLPPIDPVAAGIQRCPFLHRLASTEGDDFARSVAVNPLGPAGHGAAAAPPQRPVFEELENFSRTFRLFHGPEGVVPLANEKVEHAASAAALSIATNDRPERNVDGGCRRLALGFGAPAASMSMSNFGFLNGLGNLFNNNNSSRKPRNSRRDNSGSQQNQNKGQRPSPKARGNGPIRISASTPGPISSGQCPLRGVVGPLSAFLMKGRMHCPAPIVRMRAALNQTKVVTFLRPQDLPIKVLVIAAVSTALNIPLGALREHCRKFSPEWFLVVHATIPFVAMFRKAVIMPKYAMAFTIAAAIGSQAVGARLERKRLKKARELRSVGSSPPVQILDQQRVRDDVAEPLYLVACARDVAPLGPSTTEMLTAPGPGAITA